MPEMNATEKKLFTWLLKQGYMAKDIVFRARKNPDFLTSDGKGYEAKRIYGKTIRLSPRQFNEFKQAKNVSILAFLDDEDEPILIITSADLKLGVYEGFEITVEKERYGGSFPPKNRTSYDFLVEIVTACGEPNRITELYHKINTSFKIFDSTLKTTLRLKLVENIGDKYQTTQKGIAFLQKWAELQTFLT